MLPVPALARERRDWCSWTPNLRAIQAVGYDKDYTFVNDRAEEWERAAFEQARSVLASRGGPVQGLAFDLDLRNLVKATRFGYATRAHHGDRALGLEEQRGAYASTFVELGPGVPVTRLDQKAAGERLLLVSESDRGYTRSTSETTCLGMFTSARKYSAGGPP